MTPTAIFKDIEKGIEFPFKFVVKAEKVLESAITHEPELKSVLTTLIGKCEIIAADTAKDVLEKGLSLPDDLTTILAVKDLGEYVKSTLIPLVTKLYGEVKTDLQGN